MSLRSPAFHEVGRADCPRDPLSIYVISCALLEQLYGMGWLVECSKIGQCGPTYRVNFVLLSFLTSDPVCCAC